VVIRNEKGQENIPLFFLTKQIRQGMDIDIIRQIEQPINTLLEKMEGCSEFLMM
jgi:hypothetical protein